jgi:hypothetical protein
MPHGPEREGHVESILLTERPPYAPRCRRIWSQMPLAVLVSVTIVGCGGSDGLVPVSGTVAMDGAPLQAAVVMFHPQPGVKGNGGGASTDATGKFTLLSPQGKKGIFPGDYTITVSLRKLSSKAEQQIQTAKHNGITPMISDRDAKEVVPKAFAKPETSPLRVSVGAKGADVPVEIDSSAASAKPGK